MLKTISISACTGVMLLGSSLAQSNTDAPLKLTIKGQLVQSDTLNGKVQEKLVDIGQRNSPLPGSVIQYTITGQNTVKQPLGNIDLRLPVPRNTTYLSQSCGVMSPAVKFSIATRTFDKAGSVTNINVMPFAAAPLYRTVTVKENGQDVTKKIEIQPVEYTAVSWMIPTIAVGKSATCSLRVKVI